MRKLLHIGAVSLLFFTGVSYASVVGQFSSGLVEGVGSGALKSLSMAAVPAGLGVNYGHFTFGYTDFGPGGIVQTDLANLKAAGVQYVRIAMTLSDQNSATTTLLDLATTTAAYGFTTTYGFSGPDNVLSPFSSSTMSSYFASAEALCLTAISQGVQNCSLGNELESKMDGTTITIAQFQNDLQGYACYIKTLYPSAKVSYQAQSNQIANWNSNYQHGNSCLDYVGFNVYGTGTTMAANAATIIADFGINGYISEWNDDGIFVTGGITHYNGDEHAWAQEMQNELIQLKASGLREYDLFTYRSDSSYQGGALSEWALVNNSTNRIYALTALGL